MIDFVIRVFFNIYISIIFIHLLFHIQIIKKPYDKDYTKRNCNALNDIFVTGEKFGCRITD